MSTFRIRRSVWVLITLSFVLSCDHGEPLARHVREPSLSDAGPGNGARLRSRYTFDDAKKAIHELHAALNALDGLRATRWVSDSTVHYFDGIRQRALEKKMDEIAKEPFWVRYFALLVLHELSRDELVRETGPSFFALIVAKGLLKSDSPSPLQPHPPLRWKEGEYVVAVALGEESDPYYAAHLRLGPNGLCMDLGAFVRSMDQSQYEGHRQMAREQGKWVNDLIVETIEKRTGRAIAPGIRRAFLRLSPNDPHPDPD